jgi:hypothetical protein
VTWPAIDETSWNREIKRRHGINAAIALAELRGFERVRRP